MSMEKGKLKKS